MLTACPECKSQVSDKAMMCPHCGYPLDSKEVQKVRRNTKKRMKLPNGFGQITEIKDRNLRTPFRAMVTIGKSEEGKPICKILDYYKTYNEAYQGLMEYHKTPYDLSDKKTVEEVYELWFERHSRHVGESRQKMIRSSWKYCSTVYTLPISKLRISHIKDCMENGTVEKHGELVHPSYTIQNNIKHVFNQMLDYALEFDMVTKNVSREFTMEDKPKTEIAEDSTDAHIPFTEEEMHKLWENLDTVPYVDLVIIQAYTGLRPQEMGLIRIDSVDLTNRKFIGGMKTNAGTNRTVPIHPRIYDMIVSWYNKAIEVGSEYLLFVPFKDPKKKKFSKLSYHNYYARFTKVRDTLELNPEHKPHDPRKHFITMAKKYKVDEYAIKYIVGHSITDLTENVYTDREDSWLLEEMQKIK